MRQTKFSEFGKTQKKKKKPTRTVGSIRKQFIGETRKIWRNAPSFIDELDVEVKIKEKQKVMAQLVHDARVRQWANNDYIYRCPTKVKLEISKKALSLPEKQFRNIMGHESIHLGYPRHDRNFAKLADKHGIGITYAQVKGEGYKLQFKEGSRYKTYKTFKTKKEANDYYDKHLKGKTKKRWRLHY